MKLVSPLLKHVVYPGLSKGGFLQCAAAAGPMVLTYHGVLPPGYKVVDPALDGNLVSTDSFREQLQLLKNRYQMCTRLLSSNSEADKLAQSSGPVKFVFDSSAGTTLI